MLSTTASGLIPAAAAAEEEDTSAASAFSKPTDTDATTTPPMVRAMPTGAILSEMASVARHVARDLSTLLAMPRVTPYEARLPIGRGLASTSAALAATSTVFGPGGAGSPSTPSSVVSSSAHASPGGSIAQLQHHPSSSFFAPTTSQLQSGLSGGVSPSAHRPMPLLSGLRLTRGSNSRSKDDEPHQTPPVDVDLLTPKRTWRPLSPVLDAGALSSGGTDVPSPSLFATPGAHTTSPSSSPAYKALERSSRKRDNSDATHHHPPAALTPAAGGSMRFRRASFIAADGAAGGGGIHAMLSTPSGPPGAVVPSTTTSARKIVHASPKSKAVGLLKPGGATRERASAAAAAAAGTAALSQSSTKTFARSAKVPNNRPPPQHADPQNAPGRIGRTGRRTSVVTLLDDEPSPPAAAAGAGASAASTKANGQKESDTLATTYSGRTAGHHAFERDDKRSNARPTSTPHNWRHPDSARYNNNDTNGDSSLALFYLGSDDEPADGGSFGNPPPILTNGSSPHASSYVGRPEYDDDEGYGARRTSAGPLLRPVPVRAMQHRSLPPPSLLAAGGTPRRTSAGGAGSAREVPGTTGRDASGLPPGTPGAAGRFARSAAVKGSAAAPRARDQKGRIVVRLELLVPRPADVEAALQASLREVAWPAARG